MKKRNKSKMTVIVLFIMMLVSIALLILFIILASNNLEENQRKTTESQPFVEEQISLNEILPTASKDEFTNFICLSCENWREVSV